jgi:hypothetical protein
LAFAEIAAEVLEELRPSAGAKGIELCWTSRPTYRRCTATRARAPHSDASAEQRRQIHGARLGTTVLAAVDGRHQFAVADSGIGIPVQEQLRIFEPFAHVTRCPGKAPTRHGLG